VEVKLRPIHEDMLEVAQLFQKRHFARWIVGTGADFYGPIYRRVRTCLFHADLHLSAGPCALSLRHKASPTGPFARRRLPAHDGLARGGTSARMFGECVSAGTLSPDVR
jgi:hypothetical protein